MPSTGDGIKGQLFLSLVFKKGQKFPGAVLPTIWILTDFETVKCINLLTGTEFMSSSTYELGHMYGWGQTGGYVILPVIFLFVIQTAMASLEKVLVEHSICLLSLTWLPDNEDGTDNGTMTGQKWNKSGDFFEFFRSIHAETTAAQSWSLKERTWLMARAYCAPTSNVVLKSFYSFGRYMTTFWACWSKRSNSSTMVNK